jgi:uncharacterized membrane protein
MDRLFDDIGHAWDRGIGASGKEAHVLVLLAFLASFGFIRTSAHLIRAGVSWWPGNVQTKGGTHVHHLVWGILLLMTCGYVGVAVAPDSPWREIVAVLFGIGMGLTLDEFALWLNLSDVYWSQKGRESIDAVVVAATLLGITLVGLGFWIDLLEAFLVFLGVGGSSLSAGESTAVLVPLQVLGVLLAAVCFLKGRKLAGAIGLFLPAVALVGAAWRPRSGSWWARRRSGSRNGTPESHAPTRAR